MMTPSTSKVIKAMSAAPIIIHSATAGIRESGGGGVCITVFVGVIWIAMVGPRVGVAASVGGGVEVEVGVAVT